MHLDIAEKLVQLPYCASLLLAPCKNPQMAIVVLVFTVGPCFKNAYSEVALEPLALMATSILDQTAGTTH